MAGCYFAPMSITLNNVTRIFGEQKAVDAISFTANKGEILGFLGPNGAGKSTTMKMITGYLQPTEGNISVNGIDVLKMPQEAKKITGYLPESNALYHDMFVREYLRFTASAYGIKHTRDLAETTIGMVGLKPEAHKKIGELSKGYKQRVGIGAAIIHRPEVIILDEPTSGLDPNQIVEIRQLIRQLSENKTVLLSTHIMQEVEAICDSVVIINKGKIVANDSLQRLKTGSKKALRVGFEEVLEAQWLKRLAGVSKLNRVHPQLWELEGDDTDAIRRQVLQLAQKENLNITSIQKSGGSLETIFRNLTIG